MFNAQVASPAATSSNRAFHSRLPTQPSGWERHQSSVFRWKYASCAAGEWKPRRAGSPAEKSRLNVTRTLRHAVAYLSTALPELGAHLNESLVTGVSCSYEPRRNITWTT